VFFGDSSSPFEQIAMTLMTTRGDANFFPLLYQLYDHVRAVKVCLIRVDPELEARFGGATKRSV